jgi:hypothetical protein
VRNRLSTHKRSVTPRNRWARQTTSQDPGANRPRCPVGPPRPAFGRGGGAEGALWGAGPREGVRAGPEQALNRPGTGAPATNNLLRRPSAIPIQRTSVLWRFEQARNKPGTSAGQVANRSSSHERRPAPSPDYAGCASSDDNASPLLGAWWILRAIVYRLRRMASRRRGTHETGANYQRREPIAKLADRVGWPFRRSPLMEIDE